jgi:hypothetical protein
MFRSQRALIPTTLAVVALAAACGSSSSKSSGAMHEGTTSAAAMHETTTAAAMHESTTAGAMHESTTAEAMMAHLAGSMSADYIKAADQTSDGTTLVVEDVGLHGHSGFVVAVADNGGAMGDALGVSALVHEGATMGVNVPLTKPLSASAKVFVVLHVDNGDGTYSSADPPATVNGKVVELPVEVTIK